MGMIFDQTINQNERKSNKKLINKMPSLCVFFLLKFKKNHHRIVIFAINCIFETFNQ